MEIKVDLKWDKEEDLLYVFLNDKIVIDNIVLDSLEISKEEPIESILEKVLWFMEDYLSLVGKSEIGLLNKEMRSREGQYKNLEGASYQVKLTNLEKSAFPIRKYKRMIELSNI